MKEHHTNVIRQKPIGVVARQSTDCYAVRNPLVAEALHWIQHHFQRGIQATDVAEAVGITQQGLQKAFKESYVRSPGQEIRYQRARAVADLLKCTDATLETISKNCGYCSVDTLINGFKAVYECTPGKYRKQNQLQS
jgi:LacI family transcriptional regulator